MNLKFKEPPIKKNEDIKLNKQINFKNIFYKYPNSDKFVLNDISLNIPVNSKIGIVGSTGGGKTTWINFQIITKNIIIY